MIGQTNIQNRVSALIESSLYPRFTILTGQRGSGKKLLARQIAKQLNGFTIMVDSKVDSIREMIEQSYKVATTTVYIIADADNMSVAARNALLKVTEEPPNNVYFIMTLQDSMNTLATIRSRGTVFSMDAYTVDDIKQCIGTVTDLDTIKRFVRLCETPYDVQLLKSYDSEAFLSYVQLVFNNIAEVSGANAFKIADKIALADEPDKYDLRLFWRAFIYECALYFREDSEKYMGAIAITTKYLQDLRTSSINKSFTFDMWLLDIRAEWMA